MAVFDQFAQVQSRLILTNIVGTDFTANALLGYVITNLNNIITKGDLSSGIQNLNLFSIQTPYNNFVSAYQSTILIPSLFNPNTQVNTTPASWTLMQLTSYYDGALAAYKTFNVMSYAQNYTFTYSVGTGSDKITLSFNLFLKIDPPLGDAVIVERERMEEEIIEEVIEQIDTQSMQQYDDKRQLWSVFNPLTIFDHDEDLGKLNKDGTAGHNTGTYNHNKQEMPDATMTLPNSQISELTDIKGYVSDLKEGAYNLFYGKMEDGGYPTGGHNNIGYDGQVADYQYEISEWLESGALGRLAYDQRGNMFGLGLSAVITPLLLSIGLPAAPVYISMVGADLVGGYFDVGDYFNQAIFGYSRVDIDMQNGLMHAARDGLLENQQQMAFDIFQASSIADADNVNDYILKQVNIIPDEMIGNAYVQMVNHYEDVIPIVDGMLQKAVDSGNDVLKNQLGNVLDGMKQASHDMANAFRAVQELQPIGSESVWLDGLKMFDRKGSVLNEMLGTGNNGREALSAIYYKMTDSQKEMLRTTMTNMDANNIDPSGLSRAIYDIAYGHANRNVPQLINPVQGKFRIIGNKIATFLHKHPSLKKSLKAVGFAGTIYTGYKIGAFLQKDFNNFMAGQKLAGKNKILNTRNYTQPISSDNQMLYPPPNPTFDQRLSNSNDQVQITQHKKLLDNSNDIPVSKNEAGYLIRALDYIAGAWAAPKNSKEEHLKSSLENIVQKKAQPGLMYGGPRSGRAGRERQILTEEVARLSRIISKKQMFRMPHANGSRLLYPNQKNGLIGKRFMQNNNSDSFYLKSFYDPENEIDIVERTDNAPKRYRRQFQQKSDVDYQASKRQQKQETKGNKFFQYYQ